MNLGGAERESEYDQIHCMEFSKELIKIKGHLKLGG